MVPSRNKDPPPRQPRNTRLTEFLKIFLPWDTRIPYERDGHLSSKQIPLLLTGNSARKFTFPGENERGKEI